MNTRDGQPFNDPEATLDHVPLTRIIGVGVLADLCPVCGSTIDSACACTASDLRHAVIRWQAANRVYRDLAASAGRDVAVDRALLVYGRAAFFLACGIVIGLMLAGIFR